MLAAAVEQNDAGLAVVLLDVAGHPDVALEGDVDLGIGRHHGHQRRQAHFGVDLAVPVLASPDSFSEALRGIGSNFSRLSSVDFLLSLIIKLILFAIFFCVFHFFLEFLFLSFEQCYQTTRFRSNIAKSAKNASKGQK